MSEASLLEAPPAAPAATAGARSLERVLNLEIPVTVCFGEREITLRDLATLGPGSVVELDRAAGGPVDLLVNGRLVARGELMVIDQQYAVRITDVASTGERIQSLGRQTGA